MRCSRNVQAELSRVLARWVPFSFFSIPPPGDILSCVTLPWLSLFAGSFIPPLFCTFRTSSFMPVETPLSSGCRSGYLPADTLLHHFLATLLYVGECTVRWSCRSRQTGRLARRPFPLGFWDGRFFFPEHPVFLFRQTFPPLISFRVAAAVSSFRLCPILFL